MRELNNSKEAWKLKLRKIRIRGIPQVSDDLTSKYQ
jgi:hypothetical protein